MEKDKTQMQREIEDVQAALDSEGKGRGNAEKLAKQLELQVRHLYILPHFAGHTKASVL